MAEFDAYALEYERLLAESVRPAGYSPDYFAEAKVKEVHRVLTREGLGDRPIAILDFGCGIGRSEPFFARHFPRATICGWDVSVESIRMARRNHSDLTSVRFEHFNEGRPLSLAGSFDVVFVANVFHHIPRERHEQTVRALRNCLAPGGSVFVFEHNPYNPLTVRAVHRCPLDVQAVLLRPSYTVALFHRAGFGRAECRFTLFFPRMLGLLHPLEAWLGWLPMGAQYYVRART